jgi:polyhydroxybutyrate depolymerase
MFHGSGGTGEKMYNTTSWKAQADAEGFMVVYPTALKFHVFSDEKVVQGQIKTDVAVYQTKWNSYELPGLLDEKFPDQELHDDVAFTREIVDFVNENYATDESRFYATGFSNGGQFTARLAIETTDVFSAFAPTGAGSIPDQVLAAAEAQAETKSELIFTARPVMQMIGEEDPKLTHSSGVEAFNMAESAATEGDPVWDRYMNNYLALEGLTDSYTYERTERVAHFTFDEPVDAGSDAAYHMLIVENMGHTYPNGINYPINAAEIFWTFFQEYSLE